MGSEEKRTLCQDGFVFLFDVYNSCGLLARSRKMVRGISCLQLSAVLETRGIQRKFCRYWKLSSVRTSIIWRPSARIAASFRVWRGGGRIVEHIKVVKFRTMCVLSRSANKIWLFVGRIGTCLLEHTMGSVSVR